MKVLIPFIGRHVGGTSSFFHKFIAGLRARGISVTQEAEPGTQLALIMPMAPLWKIRKWKKQGIKIVQRLDGVYYFRVKGILYPLFNFHMREIHRKWADFVVYQSKFSESACRRFLGPTKKPHKIIYNGVDLEKFAPDQEQLDSSLNDKPKIFFTAAHFRREEMLLPIVRATHRLRSKRNDFKLLVAGKISRKVRHAISRYKEEEWIEFLGPIDHQQLTQYEKSSDLFLFSDTSACPNSVIEALASGLPIVAFDRGGVGELFNESCGALISHSRNEYWRLADFDEEGFCRGMENMLKDLKNKKKAARAQAEKRFSLDSMVEEYVQVFKNALRH